jgi:hypothetical protein
MKKPKKHDYRIQYIDNTYQIVDWSKPEFQAVGQAMEDDKAAVLLEEGIFKLSDIRAIVFLPPVPVLTPEEQKAKEEDEAGLSEWGFTEPDVQEWLKSQGIDPNKPQGVN